MIVKIEADDLPEEITKQLKGWAGGELRRQINEAIRETAETGAKMLQETSPKRSGKYGKSWEATLRKKKYSAIIGTEQYSVHNKKYYRLSHLLEKGHVSRNGGRVRPYEHIRQTEEFLETLVVSNVNKKISGGTT